jgi:hypothetical protein
VRGQSCAARLFLSIALGVLGVAPGFAGCGTTCNGTKVDGVCQTTCRDELCERGAKCFDNACRLECASGADCPSGEACRGAITDYGTKGKFCIGEPKRVAGTTGEPCKTSDDCQTKYGFRCIDEACALTCELHAQCGNAGSCTGTATDTEKNAVRTCEKDAFEHGTGQYGSTCPNVTGADAGAGAGCDAKNDFVCVGRGPGDVDAYCTQEFCGSDDDCPTGFFCSTDRVDAPPCDDSCGFTGAPTDPACIHAADIGASKHYQCGPVTLTVNLCRHREFCSPCKSDADCLGKANQICAADQSGEKICTVLCDPNLNSCPWGSAAVCGQWDKDRGVTTCAHRFGSCHGMGQGCEPCREETDCPGGICKDAQFTDERYCVDLTTKCTCPAGTDRQCTGGGCPRAPSGEPLTCLGGDLYQTSTLGNVCFGANTDLGSSASREGCWPSL